MATIEEEQLANLIAQQEGFGFSPRENIYGSIGSGIASALPKMVNPYGSTGSNIATVLGGSLVAGLLGYQARQEAEERNKALMPVFTNVLGAQDMPALTSALSGVDPDIARKLAPYVLQQATTLRAQEAAQAKALAEEERALRKAKELQRLKTEGAKELEKTRQTNRESLEKLKADIKKQKDNGTYAFPSVLGDLNVGQSDFIAEMTGATNSMTDLIKRIETMTQGEFAIEKFGSLIKNDKNLKKDLDTMAIQITSIYSGAQMRLDEKTDFKQFLSGVTTDTKPEKIIQFMENAVKRYRKDSADRISAFTFGDNRDTPLRQLEQRLRNTPFNQPITFEFNGTPTIATQAGSENVQKRIQQIEAQLTIPGLDPAKKDALERYLERLRNG